MEKVVGISSATVYVDDYQQALAFYQKHFGFEIKHRMGESASWGKIGEAALYIEGGNKPADITEKTVRASVVFSVKSAKKFFNQLKVDDINFIHSEPQNMGGGNFFFFFRDPAGNILEILGGE